MDFDVEGLRGKGWRQGALVLQPDMSRLELTPPIEADPGPDDCLIVVSHDCDLLHRELEKEPFVEFVVARSVESAAGDILFAKSPRRLALQSAEYTFEVDAHSKCRAYRQAIMTLAPGGFLSDLDLRILRRWLANRYSRAAFPDAFNGRSSRVGEKVKKILRGVPDLSGIFLSTTEVELAAADPYRIVVIGCMPALAYGHQGRRIACQEAVDKISSFLDGCDGIEVVDSELRSEAAVSLDDLHFMKRWDYDSLSYRDDSGSLTPEVDKM